MRPGGRIEAQDRQRGDATCRSPTRRRCRPSRPRRSRTTRRPPRARRRRRCRSRCGGSRSRAAGVVMPLRSKSARRSRSAGDRCRGSNASRKASPSALNANTVARIASPGKSASHHQVPANALGAVLDDRAPARGRRLARRCRETTAPPRAGSPCDAERRRDDHGREHVREHVRQQPRRGARRAHAPRRRTRGRGWSASRRAPGADTPNHPCPEEQRERDEISRPQSAETTMSSSRRGIGDRRIDKRISTASTATAEVSGQRCRTAMPNDIASATEPRPTASETRLP